MSAEHVSSVAAPLNLKKFIYDLDVPVIVGGASTYTAALHLMRTGAAGVLVGFGGGAASTTRATLGIHAPMATAVADVAGARRDYLDESGGRYVHVIADGGVGTSGDMVKALAMGADAVMLGVALARATDAPGGGYHWGPEAHHPRLPRGRRVKVDQVANLEEVLYGPGPRGGRHREPDRRAAQVDGDHRLLGPQGVPARRRRGGAVRRSGDLRRDRPSDEAQGRSGSERLGPTTVFPPTLREVMLRPQWLLMLALCLVVAGVFAWLGQWQLARAIDTDPPPAGMTEQVRPIAEVVQPGEYLQEPLVGQRVDVEGTWVPEDFIVVSSRFNDGVEGYWVTGQLRVSAASTGLGDQPVSLAVAVGWAPTREEADAAASALEEAHRRAARPSRSSSRAA